MYPICHDQNQSHTDNIKMFRQICGKNGLSKVILVTTRWDLCPETTGSQREEELRDSFWRSKIDAKQMGYNAGMPMKRLMNEPGSAWEVIETVLERWGSPDTELDGVILHVLYHLQNVQVRSRSTQEALTGLQRLLNGSGSSITQRRREHCTNLFRQIQELEPNLGDGTRIIKSWLSLVRRV